MTTITTTMTNNDTELTAPKLFRSFTNAELQQLLRNRKCLVTGVKEELIERLLTYSLTKTR